MDINVIIASTVGLFVITLLLVTMLLFAKAKLLPSGPVKLIINGEKNVEEIINIAMTPPPMKWI